MTKRWIARHAAWNFIRINQMSSQLGFEIEDRIHAWCPPGINQEIHGEVLMWICQAGELKAMSIVSVQLNTD